jgi:hypothetical protein
MYVVDASVLSHGSPLATRPRADVRRWLADNGERLYLSVVTLTEITFGIEWLRHKGSTRKAALLQSWLSDVLVFHAGRVIAVDRSIATRAGTLLATARAAGAEIDIEDALIAATADEHDMTVLTRNLRHFRPTGVAAHNPLDSLPTDIGAPSLT